MNASVSLICLHCNEPIIWGDDLCRALIMTQDGPRLQHAECELRAVVGGLNHQMGLCSCCGNISKLPPDPPGMTKREAAQAAAEYWRKHNG